tara:strand:- start:211 stop:2223 length:2013 start_codon:yes stop_codon:yes gene_type:complete
MISAQVSPEVLDLILPRVKISTAEWAALNVSMPSDSKIKGNFRLDLFPHAREILEVFDNDYHNVITVQTAAQVGKTTLGQIAIAKTAACNPHPMAWADADERSLRRVIKRTWRLFESTNDLAAQCPPKRLQPSDRIETNTFIIHGAWAGSSASAADYGAFVVVLNETDKMIPKSTSIEADFRYLMAERPKGYVGSKLLEFSTPTMKDTSYIEQRRLQGDNRGLFSPCPFCNHFQQMKTGTKHTAGGIRFAKLNGKLNADKAEETAHYRCEACKKKIQEHQRFQMLTDSVWVPEGCKISTAGKLSGTAKRKGKHASFGPIPTLVSLLPGISIGVVAREFVAAETAPDRERTARRRNVINSWDGETYDPRPPTVLLHELTERLATDDAESVELLRVCPEWSTFATVAADVGRVGDDLLFWWWVSAWARTDDPDDSRLWGKRGQLVDYGECYGEDTFRDLITEWQTEGFPHADGKGNMRVVRVGVDSGRGVDALRVYTFCDKLADVYPLKGSSTNFASLIDVAFKSSTTKTVSPRVLKMRKRMGYGDIVLVNSQQTQQWRLDQTTGIIKRNSLDWYSIPGEACTDHDMLNQLIADYPSEGKNGGIIWDRSGANEYGDTWRYSYAMAEHFGTRNGAKWDRIPKRIHPDESAVDRGEQRRTPIRTPTGKSFVAQR